MPESHHTPGPWMKTTENRGAIPEHFRPYAITTADGERVIARLPDGRGPEDRANADVLAAAPDLLAACEEYIAYRQGNDGNVDEIAQRMKAAIAKAKAG